MKRDVLKICTTFTGKFVSVSFLIKLSEICNFIKKETLAQVFSCEFCKNFSEHLLHRTTPGNCFCLT